MGTQACMNKHSVYLYIYIATSRQLRYRFQVTHVVQIVVAPLRCMHNWSCEQIHRWSIRYTEPIYVYRLHCKTSRESLPFPIPLPLLSINCKTC